MLVTILTDASWCPDTGASGYGYWIASGRGKRPGGNSMRRAANPTHAEMMAIANGLTVALGPGWLRSVTTSSSRRTAPRRSQHSPGSGCVMSHSLSSSGRCAATSTTSSRSTTSGSPIDTSRDTAVARRHDTGPTSTATNAPSCTCGGPGAGCASSARRTNVPNEQRKSRTIFERLSETTRDRRARMDLFHRIDDAEAVVRLRGGVYKQTDVYHRGDKVYIRHGSGYVRLCARFGDDTWGTSAPGVTVVDISQDVPGLFVVGLPRWSL